MGAREKPEKQPESVLGLSLPSDASDASAWKPSKAANDLAREAERLPTAQPQKQEASSWRPSEAARERLSALGVARGRRRFAIPRGVRVAASVALFAIGVYVFLKLWLMPTAGDLRPALLIFIGAMILLLVAAIAGSFARRRRHKREDEKSTLRL